MGGTINVSSTLDITSNLGVVNCMVISLLLIITIHYVLITYQLKTLILLIPQLYSVDNGNNLGVELTITLQLLLLLILVGTSIADFEESSFTATSTCL